MLVVDDSYTLYFSNAPIPMVVTILPGEKIGKLPWILIIMIFLLEFIDAILQWRPICVMTLYAPQVWPLDLKTTDMVHLIGLDKA
jgi:hypothetical protein